QDGRVQSPKGNRHATGAIGISHPVGVERSGGIGGERYQIEAERRRLGEGHHVIHLDVLHVNLVWGSAGQSQQGETRQLRDDAAAVDELRQRDPQFDELAGLQFDAGNGDKADLHKSPSLPYDHGSVLSASSQAPTPANVSRRRESQRAGVYGARHGIRATATSAGPTASADVGRTDRATKKIAIIVIMLPATNKGIPIQRVRKANRLVSGSRAMKMLSSPKTMQ